MKIFDSHFHIIDPNFPLVANQGFIPEPFFVKDYLDQTSGLNISGGAIVSGSFQAFDSQYLIQALKLMGPSFVGVANIPMNITQVELENLHQAGVVAVRFNLNRGVADDPEEMVLLSNHLFNEFGWHTELYVDSASLRSLRPCLGQLPNFSIDHLGLSHSGTSELLYWVERGAKIKATGFGRLDFSPVELMKEIMSINSDALMFGTDLPSTRAKIPFNLKDVLLLKENFNEAECEKIFFTNAQQFYFPHVLRRK